MAEGLDLFGFDLSAAQMASIDSIAAMLYSFFHSYFLWLGLDRQPRRHRPERRARATPTAAVVYRRQRRVRRVGRCG